MSPAKIAKSAPLMPRVEPPLSVYLYDRELSVWGASRRGLLRVESMLSRF